MSPQEIILIDEIEDLRNRIDILRNEIWRRDKANMTAECLVNELEDLLREYIKAINKHESIAC